MTYDQLPIWLPRTNTQALIASIILLLLVPVGHAILRGLKSLASDLWDSFAHSVVQTDRHLTWGYLRQLVGEDNRYRSERATEVAQLQRRLDVIETHLMKNLAFGDVAVICGKRIRVEGDSKWGVLGFDIDMDPPAMVLASTHKAGHVATNGEPIKTESLRYGELHGIKGMPDGNIHEQIRWLCEQAARQKNEGLRAGEKAL